MGNAFVKHGRITQPPQRFQKAVLARFEDRMKETEGIAIPSAVEVIWLPSPFTEANLEGMNGVIFEEGR